MREINIAKTIVNKRKEKGITQDELANYIGVSKASVSKWETGQSYPDITFLPQLAAYFNISIDDLMGYEPQMTKEDIRKLYSELANDFATKPFDEVLDKCREIAKKYFSCFPLLFQIGALLINYSSLANEKEKSAFILVEAKELCVRVKEESDDAELASQALGLEAVCAHMLGNPNEVLELLGETNESQLSTEPLLAAAYQMTGKIKEAKTVLQVGIHQHIIALLGIIPSYLLLYADDVKRFEEVYQRAANIADIFNIKKLHPTTLLNFYLSASQGYSANNNMDKSLEMLEKYTEIATGDIYPLRLKGDDFFDLLDEWIDEFALGAAPPRDEKSIRQSMLDAITNNPAFSPLADKQRFQSVVKKLNYN